MIKEFGVNDIEYEYNYKTNTWNIFYINLKRNYVKGVGKIQNEAILNAIFSYVSK